MLTVLMCFILLDIFKQFTLFATTQAVEWQNLQLDWFLLISLLSLKCILYFLKFKSAFICFLE